MLKTLSPRERRAVKDYDREARDGDLDRMPIWADEFTQLTYFRLTQESEVIDVGCGWGRGIPVLEMLGIRRIFGVDPSKECIKICRRNLPRYEFEVDEIRTIGDHYPNRFDGFFLLAVLMHIPRADIVSAISSLRRCLKVGAVGFFSTPMGSDGKLEVVSRQGLDLTLFTPEEVIQVFAANGFELRRLETPDGHMLLGDALAV